MTRNCVLAGIGVALLAATVWQASVHADSLRSRSQKLAPVETAPSQPERVRAEGRLLARPGAEVVLGTETGGTLVRLAFEKDRVRKGEVLAELDSSVERAALAEARARAGEVEADIALFQVEVERMTKVVAANAASKQTLDRAVRDLEAARARREVALASANRCEAALGKLRVVSPQDGVVVARHAEAGETVAPGSRLVTVADLSRTRIEAEVDEFDSDRLALGAKVTVTAEGFLGRSWRATVEEIPDAVTARRLRPQDPGRPTDTRVLLVKVSLDEPTPLRLGQRVELEIGTNAR